MSWCIWDVIMRVGGDSRVEVRPCATTRQWPFAGGFMTYNRGEGLGHPIFDPRWLRPWVYDGPRPLADATATCFHPPPSPERFIITIAFAKHYLKHRIPAQSPCSFHLFFLLHTTFRSFLIAGQKRTQQSRVLELTDARECVCVF